MERVVIGYSAGDGSFSGWHCMACEGAFEVNGLKPPPACPYCKSNIKPSKPSLEFICEHHQ